MNVLKQKRGNAKACITRAVDYISTIEASTTLEMLEIRLNRIEEAWSEFSTLHYECLKHVAEEEDLQVYYHDFGTYEAKYFEAHAGLKKAIRERQSVENPMPNNQATVLEHMVNQQGNLLKVLDASNSDTGKIKLPPITIPKFSGDYKDWPSFRDLFLGSVDTKPNLTPTQKFHYLKSVLSGTAADLIQHIKISDANYTEAWDRLERRFDRVNLIVQSFVQMFLSLPSMGVSNTQNLWKITDGADEVIRGLNALNKTGRDPWLIYILLNKLDNDTKQAWSEEIGSREDASINELIEFLESRCDALEACQSLNRSATSRGKHSGPIRALVSESSNLKSQCPMCKDSHQLFQCSKFLELDIPSKRHFTKTNSVCFCCLRSGHSSKRCRSSFRCRVCKARHHHLVHLDEGPSSLTGAPLASSNSSTSSSSLNPYPVAPLVNNHTMKLNLRMQTILPTVLAKLKNKWNDMVDVRVLLDTGSQSSFITESFAQELGLKRTYARIPVMGLSSTDAGYTKGCMSINLLSRLSSSQLSVDVFVLNKLTSNLPSKSFDKSTWEYIRNLDLADPNFNINSQVDVILGADKVWSILKADKVVGPPGKPFAKKTSFGWVISGELLDVDSQDFRVSSFQSSIDVDVLLQRFWELEEVNSRSSLTTLNDPAEEHFRKTFSRDLDRKYIVSLPFKTPRPSFVGTLDAAISRLYSMERRFKRDSDLQTKYSQFMQEYLKLGHMQVIPRHEIDKDSTFQFYLPHHAVLKPDSSTTKLRVVFDGSVKDLNGNSLNSHLLIGPPIQRDLIGVCLRFRQHRFVFTADIVKMFRQIWVSDHDLDYQRIVWRESPSDEVQHYRLKTVTYGTASAPFLSVRVLQQIADDYKSLYPNASRILMNDVYVDDVMTGASSIDELLNLQSELISLLSEAGLHLRKWSSNSWALLARQNPDDCEYSFVDPERSQSLVKVLGMFWNPSADTYSYRITLPENPPTLTRRSLLSEIARIFDPLGLLAPSVILFKIMFQKLWSSELKLDWDDPLPSNLSDEWLSYREH